MSSVITSELTYEKHMQQIYPHLKYEDDVFQLMYVYLSVVGFVMYLNYQLDEYSKKGCQLPYFSHFFLFENMWIKHLISKYFGINKLELMCFCNVYYLVIIF